MLRTFVVMVQPESVTRSPCILKITDPVKALACDQVKLIGVSPSCKVDQVSPYPQVLPPSVDIANLTCVIADVDDPGATACSVTET